MKFQTTNNKKQINFKFQIQNSKPFLIKAILIFSRRDAFGSKLPAP